MRRLLRLVALSGTFLVPLVGGAMAEVDPARQAELKHLLLHDCGSCHGMTLKGGLGPSLLPEALKGKPPQLLESTILDGRFGTAMPPWRGFLTEEEARWIVQRLIDGQVANSR
ncbi:MAG: cytochrome c55X [Gammaproteobacteria bacterium]